MLIEEVHQYQQEPYHFVEVKVGSGGVEEGDEGGGRGGGWGGGEYTEKDLFNFSLIIEPKGS